MGVTDEVRPGQWWCNTHGVVTPHRGGVVPACPACMVMVVQAVTTPTGIICREPHPDRCRNGHGLSAGRMLIGWVGCRCNPEGGHRNWTCRECSDVQSWPPHDQVASPPYFGPGKDDTWRSR